MSSSSTTTESQMLFVSCSAGLEALLETELKALGIAPLRQGFCGVYAPARMPNVYLINYNSRIASRVLFPLRHFSCEDAESLYREALQIPWERYLRPDLSFAIDANVFHPQLRHSLFAAQVMKDALCDRLRERCGTRPSVDVKHPDVQLNLFIHHKKGTISLDTSGAPLYRRGWRHHPTDASMQETLAAAILYLADYSPSDRLCDPFCGSGTFLIEAALIASKTPPGFLRKKWGFVHLPEYKEEEWLLHKGRCDAQRLPLPSGHLFGADKNPQTVALCQQHLEIAGFSKEVAVEACNIKYYRPPLPPTKVITNPPYGIRLEASQEIYQSLGTFLNTYHVPKAYILSPSKEAVEHTGRAITGQFPLSHGGLQTYLFSLRGSGFGSSEEVLSSSSK